MFFKKGLCTERGKINSSIVLSGDPKQLGAVTTSEHAKKLGYKISLMERLIKKPCYMRSPYTSEFDHRYIVQLTKNYRNHPIILEIANKLFYDGTLEAKARNGWFHRFFFNCI